MVSDAKKMGFNTVYHTGFGASKEFLALADREGLMVFNENGPESMYDVASLSGCSNIMGWSVRDEPEEIQVPLCESLYRTYKQVDPYHLVTATFNSGALGYGSASGRFLDIAMPDAYPVRNEKSPMGIIARLIRTCYEVINDDPTATVIPILQFFKQDGTYGVEPLPKQVRAEAYSAITAGAKGFYFYAYFSPGPIEKGMAKNSERKAWYLPESQNLYNYAATLTRELRDLESFILFGKPCPEITVHEHGQKEIAAFPHSYSAGEDSPILWRAMSLDSKKLLVVVNQTSDLQKDILLKWPKKWSNPQVLHGPLINGDNKQISLEGYEVGVYLFQTSKSLDKDR
jgi:hypothetical protein